VGAADIHRERRPRAPKRLEPGRSQIRDQSRFLYVLFIRFHPKRVYYPDISFNNNCPTADSRSGIERGPAGRRRPHVWGLQTPRRGYRPDRTQPGGVIRAAARSVPSGPGRTKAAVVTSQTPPATGGVTGSLVEVPRPPRDGRRAKLKPPTPA
jgi:hypothetical protein